MRKIKIVKIFASVSETLLFTSDFGPADIVCTAEFNINLKLELIYLYPQIHTDFGIWFPISLFK